MGGWLCGPPEWHRVSPGSCISHSHLNSRADGNRNEDDAQTFFDYPVDAGSSPPRAPISWPSRGEQCQWKHGSLDCPGARRRLPDPDNFVTGFFVHPTPGAENTLRYDGIVDDTSFSVDRGIYESAFNLEITTNTQGASIRYTTDGSLPSETFGEIYTGPIMIDDTTVVRAIAYKEGYRSTNVDTQSYIFPADVFGPSFTDSLTAVPIISLVSQTNYDLRLMSVSSTSELPSQTVERPESSQVIVASVNGQLHVRIIDVHIRRSRETNTVEYRMVINKTESQLANGAAKTDLRNLINQIPFPDAATLSPEVKRDIIQKAITASEHTLASPFLQDGNNDYIEHKSSVELIYPDGTRGFQEDAGMSNFGGGFTNFAKKSFRLYFRKKYGAAKLEHPIFDGFEYPNFPPVDEFDAIDLRSGSHDMSARGPTWRRVLSMTR